MKQKTMGNEIALALSVSAKEKSYDIGKETHLSDESGFSSVF
jgi:hypothetical protein